jgi:predicted HicB family RNase H-like nuclease
MPPSKVFPLRASETERHNWQLAADGNGISFNAWARRSLNEQAALDEALKRQDQIDNE